MRPYDVPEAFHPVESAPQLSGEDKVLAGDTKATAVGEQVARDAAREKDETRSEIRLQLQRLRLHVEDLRSGDEELQANWLKENAWAFEKAMAWHHTDLMQAAVMLLEQGVKLLKEDCDKNTELFKKLLDTIHRV